MLNIWKEIYQEFKNERELDVIKSLGRIYNGTIIL